MQSSARAHANATTVHYASRRWEARTGCPVGGLGAYCEALEEHLQAVLRATGNVGDRDWTVDRFAEIVDSYRALGYELRRIETSRGPAQGTLFDPWLPSITDQQTDVLVVRLPSKLRKVYEALLACMPLGEAAHYVGYTYRTTRRLASVLYQSVGATSHVGFLRVVFSGAARVEFDG